VRLGQVKLPIAVRIEQVAVAVTLWSLVWEVLGRPTVVSEIFRDFPLSPQTYAGVMPRSHQSSYNSVL
jgi:hypothetical protein